MRARSIAAVVASLSLLACTDTATSPRDPETRSTTGNPVVQGASVQVFGPERFVRSTGAPVGLTRTLAAGALTNVDGPFTLRLLNGPPGTDRTSSAIVTIDGIRVIAVSDLSQKVYSLERVVELKAGSQIVVELRGAPGSAIELSIEGVAKPETAPTLLDPAQNARIPQNDKASGCPANPISGYGFRIHFGWTPATGPQQVAGYELSVGNPTVGPALLVSEIVTDTGYVANRCAFIPGASLDGWEWRVRARYVGGGVGPWSATGTFGFLPLPVPAQVLGFSLTASYGGAATRVSLSGAVDANTSASVALVAVVDVPLLNLGPPHPTIEFFWDNGATRQKIGEAGSPTLTQTQTNRWWTYTFIWDPAPPAPIGALSIVAVRTDVFGTQFESPAQIVTVVP